MDNRIDEESQTPLLEDDTLQNVCNGSNSSSDSIALNPPVAQNGECSSSAEEVHDEEHTHTEQSTKDIQDLLYLQATVLFEDAINYRSIHHKMDKFSIHLYRWYHSNHVHWALNIATYLLLLLAFIETPSSLVWSSDPRLNLKRTELPTGLTEGIELMCLLFIFISLFIQSYLTSDVEEKKLFPKKHPWLTGGFIVIILSFMDLVASLIVGNVHYMLRFRRLLRPYFLAVNNTMLKKTLKCIRNTLPEIASVLTLLLLHIYFFMMIGMLMFPQVKKKEHQHNSTEFNNTEWKIYFSSLDKSFTSLLVLLTTANNPDVMMPAYSQNRLYAIFFIVFSFIGTFLMFNLVTAVVYNQFRGYFQNSMQASYFRRCVATSAVFEILLGMKDCTDLSTPLHSSNNTSSSLNQNENVVNIKAIKHVSKIAMISKKQRARIHDYLEEMVEHTDEEVINYTQLKILLAKVDINSSQETENEVEEYVSNNRLMEKLRTAVLHKNFDLVGNVVVFVNAVFVTVEIAVHYEEAFKDVRSRLNIVNYIFVCYYSVEQILKIWAYGVKYFKKLSSIYDGVLTVTLISMEIVQISRFEHVGGSSTASTDGLSVWDCARIVNILIFLRLLRIIPNIKPMATVTSVLVEIVHDLASFVGVLVIIYYVFAIIGMMAFNGATHPDTMNGTANALEYDCGTYEQLNYWANNFDDFAASLVVLWDVMVVNNWHVFLTVYSHRVSPWSQLYFIAWWVVAVIITINLFIALILDHFIAKLDRSDNVTSDAVMRMGRRGTVHALFHNQVHEPSRIEVMEELEKHPTIRGYLFVESEDEESYS